MEVENSVNDQKIMIEELPPKFSQAEDSLALKAKQQREMSFKFVTNLQNQVGCTVLKAIQWKCSLADHMKRIKVREMEDPEHPVNTKLRRSLVECHQ